MLIYKHILATRSLGSKFNSLSGWRYGIKHSNSWFFKFHLGNFTGIFPIWCDGCWVWFQPCQFLRMQVLCTSVNELTPMLYDPGTSCLFRGNFAFYPTPTKIWKTYATWHNANARLFQLFPPIASSMGICPFHHHLQIQQKFIWPWGLEQHWAVGKNSRILSTLTPVSDFPQYSSTIWHLICPMKPNMVHPYSQGFKLPITTPLKTQLWFQ